ncbi:MAG TPA: zinc ABC transporter substrate-binding protein [Streptosporangiaceae bacterium]|nr:zinc ABC transporter substrate-binding protein [Streptosporangiaceae bacterium]
MPIRRALAAATLVAAAVVTAGCAASQASSSATARTGVVNAVGAQSTYANVISQIGGRFVHVTAVQSNPNSDPHAFEASASVSEEISSAQLIVQNGLGYDSFMNTIESATSNPVRKIIDVQQLLRLPDSTPNPHLWYSPATMPAVARAIATDLSQLRPAHTAYFESRLATFDASLKPWFAAIAAFKSAYRGAPVATTEPVGDYLLQALGVRNMTPFGLQAAVMNGVDLAPQYVTLQENLLTEHKVKVLVYNQQVVDQVTTTFLAKARQAGVPVVGVYETMPAGFTYQSWMLAEVHALRSAITSKQSTQRL